MSLYPVTTHQRMAAINLFHSIRHAALRDQLLQRLLRRHQPLADFNHLHGLQMGSRTDLGLQVVPLKHITGSVNRQGDFDRRFRPLRKHLRDRWANIFLLMQTDGWEPVTLYKVWDSYYVEDGHHRVSVALANGRQFIEARVVEVAASAPPCACQPVRIPARLASVPVRCEECA